MAVSIVILLYDALKKRTSVKKRKPKRFWIRKLIKESKSSGPLHMLTKEVEMLDQEYFSWFLRMSTNQCEHLFLIVHPELQFQRALLCEPTSPSERQNLPLRYLACGGSLQFFSFGFRISRIAIISNLADAC